MYKLLHTEESFIVVSKGENVDFHKNDNEMGLAELIARNEGFERLFPVHRLDTMTSGLLLFAKTSKSAALLAQKFKDHAIEKYYCALSDRKPNIKRGRVRGDMVRSRRSTWKLCRTTKNPALTYFLSFPFAKGLRLFIIRPFTGKTHQIRVALKSIGSPIIGDPLYYPSTALKNENLPDRGYLHASAMRFSLGEKQYTFFHAPDSGSLFVSEEFKQAFASCRVPWELDWQRVGLVKA